VPAGQTLAKDTRFPKVIQALRKKMHRTNAFAIKASAYKAATPVAIPEAQSRTSYAIYPVQIANFLGVPQASDIRKSRLDEPSACSEAIPVPLRDLE